jgi:hypothetical protein
MFSVQTKKNICYQTIPQMFVAMVDLSHRNYVGHCPLLEVYLIYCTEQLTMMDSTQYSYDATLLCTRNKSSDNVTSDLFEIWITSETGDTFRHLVWFLGRGNWPIESPRPRQDNSKQKKRSYKSMHRAVFEPCIPLVKWFSTLRPLNRTATLIGHERNENVSYCWGVSGETKGADF